MSRTRFYCGRIIDLHTSRNLGHTWLRYRQEASDELRLDYHIGVITHFVVFESAYRTV